MSPVPYEVAVVMLTFRRPEDLTEAVPAVIQAISENEHCRLVIVDNDPDGSARESVGQLAEKTEPDRISYLHEPSPGIAAARNCALDEVNADLLIFIDDDERPAPGWLRHLLATYEKSKPTGVVGPVVSEYVGDPDPWISAGRFFERRRLATGTVLEVAATNNLLLDLSQVRELGIRFDERFGLSGGSDSLFTRELIKKGGRLLWCDEAVVVDKVPVARLTRGWVIRKALRIGNSTARVAIIMSESLPKRLQTRVAIGCAGLARAIAGAGRIGFGMLSRRLADRARGTRTAARGLGMVLGVFGYVYQEYRR